MLMMTAAISATSFAEVDPQFIVCLRKPLLTENGEGFTVRKRGALLSGEHRALPPGRQVGDDHGIPSSRNLGVQDQAV
jgi:hypothetical protein